MLNLGLDLDTRHDFKQCCGSGSGSVLDPYSIGSVDPDSDPYSESGSVFGIRIRIRNPYPDPDPGGQK